MDHEPYSSSWRRNFFYYHFNSMLNTFFFNEQRSPYFFVNVSVQCTRTVEKTKTNLNCLCINKGRGLGHKKYWHVLLFKINNLVMWVFYSKVNVKRIKINTLMIQKCHKRISAHTQPHFNTVNLNLCRPNLACTSDCWTHFIEKKKALIASLCVP